MSEIDESREKAIEAGASMRSGRVNFNYVDTAKTERLGLERYDTKKPKGYNFIRIVAPNKKGAFAKEIWKHANVGADGGTYLCLEQMFGKECPVCEHIKKLKKENPDDDAIKELAAQRRFLLFVVDTTSAETEKEGPKWFDCPSTIYQQVCSLSIDKRTGKRVDPTDPENGRDIEFTRVDGKRTTYGSFALKETASVPKSWYMDLPTFEEILLVPNPEEVARALSGMSDSGGSEEKTRSRTTEESETRSEDKEPEEEVEDDRRVRRSEKSEKSEKKDSGSKDKSSEQAKAEVVRSKLDEINARRRQRRGEE